MSSILPEFVTGEGYLDEKRSSLVALSGDGRTVFTKSSLEAALQAYGEDKVLEVVSAGLQKSQVDAIGTRHFELEQEADPSKMSGAGLPFDRALALAAVEILEGRRRQLARKRRRQIPR